MATDAGRSSFVIDRIHAACTVRIRKSANGNGALVDGFFLDGLAHQDVGATFVRPDHRVAY
ncbi:MAG: hypothetical protein ACE5HE_00495 [Phycisphaerae bacterium]